MYFTESWILYRGHESGVSDIIRDAYRNYGNMEFGIVKTNSSKKEDKTDDLKNKQDIYKSIKCNRRHVKLVRIAGTMDKIEVNGGKQVLF